MVGFCLYFVPLLVARTVFNLQIEFANLNMSDTFIFFPFFQSLRVAEDAASHCTASYRAPELYDPPQGASLDTRYVVVHCSLLF